MKKRPKPKRKEPRHVSEARTRAACDTPMRLTKNGKWVPVKPDPDGGERTPSWLRYALDQRKREQGRKK